MGGWVGTKPGLGSGVGGQSRVRQGCGHGGHTYTDVRTRRDAVQANEGQRFNANLGPKHLFRLWTHYRFQPQD